ncbi:MAG: hypothetical protein ABI723_04410 [Bacteroidia bacterium]
MKNNFTNQMSKLSDVELEKVLQQRNDYQPEGVEAAEQEIKKRKFIQEKISKYSNEEILEILKSRKNYQPYEVEAASAETQKRNLHSDYEEVKIETGINEEIQKLKTSVVSERYPTLRFISGVYRFLALLVIIATAIILFYGLKVGTNGLVFSIGVIVIGGILFVTSLAAAEGIKVFIDIEHNTRISALKK